MASDCCSVALEISSSIPTIFSTLSTVRISASAVSFTRDIPFCTACCDSFISTEVFFEASADLEARLLTSEATTAKPLPASPALAASTAAFRARIFVWKAMSSMVCIMSLILSDVVLISWIASISSCILWLLSSISSPAVWACSLALRVVSALLRICPEISVMVAASSWTELACSVAPWLKAVELAATWSALTATCSEDWEIPRSVSRRDFWIDFIEVSTATKSPLYWRVISTVKLPSAIWPKFFDTSPTTSKRWETVVSRAVTRSAISSFVSNVGTAAWRSPCESKARRSEHAFIGSEIARASRSAAISAIIITIRAVP